MPDSKRRSVIMRPVLVIAAILIVLGMLRLGVWQLDRAEQKTQLVEQREALSSAERIDLDSLVSTDSQRTLSQQRYREVTATGQFLDVAPLYLDGRVYKSRVGYDVYNLFETKQGHLLLVSRGWVYAGDSRTKLPVVSAPLELNELYGRLNLLAGAPPLWNDEYPSHTGPVWQYFPIDDLTAQFGQKLLPMVLELAPALEQPGLSIHWASATDAGVSMHKGYAFQWFAMAAAFFIACLVLLIKSIRQS